ncbi:hypothetical protein AB0L70_13325 [Kribbella sp. NPDC051952]|uniref:hypothetical protein n=1 Tax=Kribbella sp. NPDC051952 TaxID=3154851 RepID=UPI00341BB29F
MNWAPFALASIPAVVSIFAATTAARSARKTKQLELLSARKTKELELQAQRIRDLENRLAEKKYSTYQPMTDTFSKMIDPRMAKALRTDDLLEEFRKFDAWIAIYGSDDALQAWHNFRQGSYHDAPALVLMRLYSDFVMAARRDMGNPDTSVSGFEVIGMRISDLYSETATDLKTLLGIEWSQVEQQTGVATAMVGCRRRTFRPSRGEPGTR